MAEVVGRMKAQLKARVLLVESILVEVLGKGEISAEDRTRFREGLVQVHLAISNGSTLYDSTLIYHKIFDAGFIAPALVASLLMESGITDADVKSHIVLRNFKEFCGLDVVEERRCKGELEMKHLKRMLRVARLMGLFCNLGFDSTWHFASQQSKSSSSSSSSSSFGGGGGGGGEQEEGFQTAGNKKNKKKQKAAVGASSGPASSMWEVKRFVPEIGGEYDYLEKQADSANHTHVVRMLIFAMSMHTQGLTIKERSPEVFVRLFEMAQVVASTSSNKMIRVVYEHVFRVIGNNWQEEEAQCEHLLESILPQAFEEDQALMKTEYATKAAMDEKSAEEERKRLAALEAEKERLRIEMEAEAALQKEVDDAKNIKAQEEAKIEAEKEKVRQAALEVENERLRAAKAAEDEAQRIIDEENQAQAMEEAAAEASRERIRQAEQNRLAEEERARLQELARLAKEKAEKEAEEQRRLDEEARIKAALEKAAREEKSKAKREEALKREKEEKEKQKEAAQEERRLQFEKEKAAQRERNAKEKEEGEERQRQKAERLRREQEDQQRISREKAEKRRQKEALLAEKLESERAASGTKAPLPKLGKLAGSKKESPVAKQLAQPVSQYSALLDKAKAKYEEGMALYRSIHEVEDDRSMFAQETFFEHMKAANLCFSLSVAFFEKIPETSSGFSPFWLPMEKSMQSYVHVIHTAVRLNHEGYFRKKHSSSFSIDDKNVDVLRKAFTIALRGQEKLSQLLIWYELGLMMDHTNVKKVLTSHGDSLQKTLTMAKEILEALTGEQFGHAVAQTAKAVRRPVPPSDVAEAADPNPSKVSYSKKGVLKTADEV